MAKKTVSKISDKLSQVNENFNVYMYDNGYMIEVSGKTDDDNWKTAKIMVGSVDELITLIREVTDMERSD
jgi:hypothetical protein